MVVTSNEKIVGGGWWKLSAQFSMRSESKGCKAIKNNTGNFFNPCFNLQIHRRKMSKEIYFSTSEVEVVVHFFFRQQSNNKEGAVSLFFKVSDNAHASLSIDFRDSSLASSVTTAAHFSLLF